MATTTAAKPRATKTIGPGASIALGERSPLVMEAILRVLSEATTRSSIASKLGMSFDGKRNLYEALGYLKTPTFRDFMARYKRQDIARAVIDIPVKACWRKTPELSESKSEETIFEADWKKLAEDRSIYSYFRRVDRMASIGAYAVLLLGFDDAGRLSEPVTNAKRLLFVAPYSEVNAPIASWNLDEKNERFGLPETYVVNMQRGSGTMSRVVHWSRVIHVAEDVLEDSVSGQSRLEPILNRLQDIELVSGASAEMFWRGGFPGYGFELDPEATTFGQTPEKLEQEIEAYMHGFKRYMKLEGLKATALAQQIVDPGPTISVLLDLISAFTRIPKRIMIGSEQGVLASVQDSENWASVVEERRSDHCEANILRPFVDRLVSVGIVAPPKERYNVDWPVIVPKGALETAQIGTAKATSLAAYAGAIGADSIVPPEIFLKEILGFTDDQIAKIDEILGKQLADMEAGSAGQPEPIPAETPPPAFPGPPEQPAASIVA